MIQAVNFSTNNYSKNNIKPSFAQKAPEEFIDYKPEELKKRNKKSKLASAAGYIATQFAAGAIVSGIIDGLINSYRAITKKGMIPLKQIGLRAAGWGGAWVIVGLVMSGMYALSARKNKD